MAYLGPGDLKSGATCWGGLRAYNAAYAAPGTNKCLKIVDAATGLISRDIKILTNGAVDYLDIASFISSNGAAKCTTLYDQSGSGNDFIQTTLSAMPSVNVSQPASLGANQVCLTFAGASSQQLISTTAIAAQAQPFVFAGLFNRTASGATTTGIGLISGSGSGGSIQLGWTATADTIEYYAGSIDSFVGSGGDGVFHGLACHYNAATSNHGYDGANSGFSVNTGNVSPDGVSTNKLTLGAAGGGQFLTGHMCEAGYWPLGFLAGDLNNITNKGGTATDGTPSYYFFAVPAPLAATITLMGAICL